MSVRVEKQGPVFTVVLSRPQARNAVDGPTAAALDAAFEHSCLKATSRPRCESQAT